MLTSRSRVRGFRRSVVQVVAAFAPLAGCDLLDQTQVISNPPACDPTPPGGCMPPVDVCPEELPNEGAGCAVEGQGCSYSAPGSYGIQATCQGGRWSIDEITPNPPVYEVCPATLPLEDTPCFISPADNCHFDGPCGAGTDYAWCNGGRWVVEPGSCTCGVDLACECPDRTPVQGDPCDLPASMVCGYMYCDTFPTEVATCVDGVWDVGYASCNPPPMECGVDLDCACPEEPPSTGGPCELPTAEPCHYGDCYGAPTITAQCVDGAWSVSEVSCNPPSSEA